MEIESVWPPLATLPDANPNDRSEEARARGWGWSQNLSYDTINLASMPCLDSEPGPTPPRPTFRHPGTCDPTYARAAPARIAVPTQPRSIGALLLGGSGGRTSSSATGNAASADAGPSAAPTLNEVHHGITLRGARLTWAVLAGVKRVENRHFRMKPGWYALHTGAKTSSHESQDPLLNAVEGMPREADLPHSCIVGVIEISHSLGLDECVAKEPWAFGPVVNVIRSVCRLPQPVAHRGALSVWRIDADVREQVLAQLPEAQVFQNDISHLPLSMRDTQMRPRLMAGGY